LLCLVHHLHTFLKYRCSGYLPLGREVLQRPEALGLEPSSYPVVILKMDLILLLLSVALHLFVNCPPSFVGSYLSFGNQWFLKDGFLRSLYALVVTLLYAPPRLPLLWKRF
jgi:hypothetical protein